MAETKIVADRVSNSVEFEFSELALGDGTESLPALAFGSDQDTGIWRNGNNRMDFTTGGSNKFTIADTFIASALQIQNINGSAATPAYSFFNDSDTGWYGLAENSMRLSIGGTQRYIFDSSSFTVINDSAALRLQRSSNGRTPEIFIYDAFGGFRFHTPNSNAESTTVAYQWQCDNPSSNTVLATLLANGQWQYQDGSASIPAISFGSDTDTGLYRPGVNGLSVSTNGTRRWTFDATGALVGNTSNSVLFVADGAAGAPGYTFDSDQDTGVYRRISDSVGVATGGSLRFDFNNSVTRSHVPMEILNSSSDATLLLDSQSTGRASQISFRNSTPVTHRIGIETDTDSGGGAFLGNANSLNFEVSGSNRMYFSNQSTARFYLDGGTLQSNTPGQMELGSAANYWGRVHLANGSAALPSYTFGGDPNTGLYSIADNLLGFTANGAEVFRYGSGSPGGIEMRNSNVIYNVDGSTSVPSYTFANDADTGLMRSASNTLAMVAGSTIAADFKTTGQSDGVRYTPFQVYGAQTFGGGAPGVFQLSMQSTASVSTTPVEIIGTEYGMLIVNGVTGGGSAIFTDFILMQYGSNATVIGSKNSNSPAARTYTLTSGDRLSLAMASGTYNIMCTFFRCPIR